MKLLNWLKPAEATVVDPNQQARVEALAKHLFAHLQADQRSFSLAAALEGQEVTPAELAAAQRHVYRFVLKRGWEDGTLDAKEQRTMAWIGHSLELPPTIMQSINVEFARHHFATALSSAFEDRILEPHELAELQTIASAVGKSTAEFMHEFFLHEGEGFLRAVFMACIEDGVFSPDEWQRLVDTAGQLGLSQAEMLHAIRPQAQQFVEHVLADAKSDGILSPSEEETLAWLLGHLDLSPEFRQYMQAQIWFMRTLTEITQGKLPSVPTPPGIQTRPDEIVHLYVPTVWRELVNEAFGTNHTNHEGTLILTNERLLFVSPTLSQQFTYDQVMSHRGSGNGIEVQFDGRPLSAFLFHGDVPLAYPVFQSAVRLGNQAKVVKVEGETSRAIPREVRQRVWQRYAGRCGECGGSEHLEFDFLIPLAKGGSRSEANLQLICRKCSLANTHGAYAQG